MCKVISKSDSVFWFCDACKGSVKEKLHGVQSVSSPSICKEIATDVDLIICKKELEYISREKHLQKIVDEFEFTNNLLKSKVSDLERQLVSLSGAPAKNHLFSNNIETKNTPSYSSVLKKPAVSDSSVLLIESKDGVSNNDVMKSLTASINPANLKICIDKTKLIKNGAAVYCRTESDRMKLEEALKTSLESKYHIIPRKN
ncbi:unnamed protein product [Acanthoscelides obtectus]|uniref:Uncharacterized protein n=1 Tax=Acanthoscelides obtectus TaxID=200917 RepID=A0A9P0MGP2_ACAOB|nr:unnamed protein product [Acanthoscelides obtectus]CAK1622941.1 hypothetical protein AOBTE_LOCUS1737 [Acanthoscelides obtectus]